LSENIKRMLAERAALNQAPVVVETDRLFEAEAEKRLFYFLEEGWNGEGWRPSHLLTLGFCALSTLPFKSSAYCENQAALFWSISVAEARRRYRAGFYADPFTTTPRWRDNAVPWSWPAMEPDL
jgi:hypothetical protein